VNVIITSILYKSSPDVVKLVLIDPKILEFKIYEDIPHLLTPVVTDPKGAAVVLDNVVKEMDIRYELIANMKLRGIDAYNRLAKTNPSLKPLPYIVVIVDEFAELIRLVGKEVENSVIRIAQKARAAGIHLIIATQRPSADVITGLIKSNIPSKISLRVGTKLDSRVVLDMNGAEQLLGHGDSLFIPPGTSQPVRVHCAFLSDKEVERITELLKQYGKPDYNMELLEEKADNAEEVLMPEGSEDPVFAKAIDYVEEVGYASISAIQRKFGVGFNRAANIVERMEKLGVISANAGPSKRREFLKRPPNFLSSKKDREPE
jgi:S-DNA-T family DNA segregation ATPase FtsK/SpoIIIE